MGRNLLNSLAIATALTLLSLAFNLSAGYAFAKLHFRGRDKLFQYLLGALVIPAQVAMIPLFLMMKSMHLVNTYGGVILPTVASVFGIFLVRQYARSIPDDLLEAARLDGAGEFYIFSRIVLPLLKPIVVTLAIFTFLASWNDFMWPLIVLSDQEWQTAPVAIACTFARTRAGQRTDDGRLRRHHPAGVDPLPRAAAPLHPGSAARKRERMIARVVGILCLLACAAAGAQTRVLDDFENLSNWRADHTDDVAAKIASIPGHDGTAMRLQFDFAGVNGYATAHRKLPLDLPDNFELSFWIRGDVGVNNLQFKLVDDSGENVWWINRPDFAFPREWQHIRIKKRQIEFAWGPTKDRALKHIASIEFVVSSGRDGGKGTVDFDQLELRTLPLPMLIRRNP